MNFAALFGKKMPANLAHSEQLRHALFHRRFLREHTFACDGKSFRRLKFLCAKTAISLDFLLFGFYEGYYG
jgi:hypothetical protein